MNYEEALEWLYSTQHFGIKLGLENAKELLRKSLAYPSFKTKVIHVAGTNGKGSTCAMMEALVRGAGLRSALFTSPHLVHFRERIVVNGVEISEDRCAKYLTDLKFVAEKMTNHPTFFELTLACAMRYFKDEAADVIVLETGMGGRFDATTAVPADVCAITPIAMDHAEYLGDTLEKVAMEKAGIILEGVPVFSSPQELDAKVVLAEEANEKRSSIEFIDEPLTGYTVGLPGEHQKWNANLAVQTVHALGIGLNYDNVKNALEFVRWSGRFEQVGDIENPVVLDGAHNPQAAEVLVETWKEEFPDTAPVMIFGAVEEKNVSEVLGFFKELVSEVIFTPIDSPRSFKTSALKEAIGDFENVTEAQNLDEAWSLACEKKKPILVAGSLFLVGQMKASLENQSFEVSSQ